MMQQLVKDLRIECQELADLLAGLTDDDWGRATVFFDWTVADEIMHLHLSDDLGLVSLTRPADFADLLAEIRSYQARGIELSHRMRDQYGHLTPQALFAAWNARWQQLCALFETRAAEDRIPWFGPDMSVASFAAARQMEVWAHAQDIFDLFRVRRTNGDRIRGICDLGVRTQGWSFRNRGLEKSASCEVRLMAPSGAVWTWSEGAAESIVGSAEDFALVVTQRRHVDDTALAVTGEGARAWMEIAQCFAGEAETGPAPGVRVVDYPD